MSGRLTSRTPRLRMDRMKSALLAAAMLLGAAAPEGGVLEGRVVDDAGNPVGNAAVLVLPAKNGEVEPPAEFTKGKQIASLCFYPLSKNPKFLFNPSNRVRFTVEFLKSSLNKGLSMLFHSSLVRFINFRSGKKAGS